MTPRHNAKSAIELEPFEAKVAPELLDDLHRRLARTRWPPQADGVGEEDGIAEDYMRDMMDYWAQGFDWRAQEARLNSLPQFRTSVDGLGIHFISVHGKGPDPLPLIVTHGWPGSVFEFLELIPRLADPAAHRADPRDAFHVVAPSLPGYGFSDRPPPGVHPGRVAELWLRLMAGLGYHRFGAQGGDWGASVATRLALLSPERVVGIHLNYLPGSYRPWVGPGASPLTAAEAEFRAACEAWAEMEGAYAHIHRTKPATLAYGLSDSPAGLAAWMLEKLRAWSAGGPRPARDDLLANVTLYWVTATIGSSMRLYREASRHPLQLRARERIRVPTGLALFPAESPANPPREWVERGYEVTRWRELPRGGHFAAWEEPDLLAEEIRAFFRPLRG